MSRCVPAEFAAWFEKRNAVNRYFASLGYENINLNRKTWCEGPYGREKQLANQPPPDHRNWLTTDATARLFTEIVTGRAVTPERSRQMLELHARQPFDPEGKPWPCAIASKVIWVRCPSPMHWPSFKKRSTNASIIPIENCSSHPVPAAR